MSASRLRRNQGEALVPLPANDQLAKLSHLSVVDIETPLVANLSDDLHAMFDHVSDGALPIYFGPLLGRLYLAGL